MFALFSELFRTSGRIGATIACRSHAATARDRKFRKTTASRVRFRPEADGLIGKIVRAFFALLRSTSQRRRSHNVHEEAEEQKGEARAEKRPHGA